LERCFEEPVAMCRDIRLSGFNLRRFGVPKIDGRPATPAYYGLQGPYKRAMPVRMLRVSLNAHGKPCTVMSLQKAWKQQKRVRREKGRRRTFVPAQSAAAVMAFDVAVSHGPDGLSKANCTSVFTTQGCYDWRQSLEEADFKSNPKSFLIR